MPGHHPPRRHAWLAGAAVVLGLLAVPASAAEPRCPLVSDPAGDVTLGTSGLRVERDHVDLRAADVLVNRSHLVAMIRVADISGSDNGRWYLRFTIGATDYSVEAYRDQLYLTRFTATAGNDFAVKGVTGVFDEARNEARVLVPLKSLGAAAPRSGATLAAGLTRVVATEYTTYPYLGARVYSDRGERQGSYVLGRSC